jgi:cbb3-type cytochrome oxidase subunit 3
MKLSDVVSHAGLAFYAEVALIVFFAVFVAIVVRLFASRRSRDMERMARLPLDDTPEEHPRSGVPS